MYHRATVGAHVTARVLIWQLACVLDHGAQRLVLLFHVLFKALALLSFILSGIVFRGSYVVTFVVVTILSALDFWTVKNVSGRLLVGVSAAGFEP